MISNLNIMVDEKVKKEATEIFSEIGLDISTAINIFLRGAIRKKGFPFELSINNVDDFANFNDETMEAIEETERISKDPSTKGYSSAKELRKALKI